MPYPMMLHCHSYRSWQLDLTLFSLSLTLTVVFIMVLVGRISLLCVRAKFFASKIQASWSPTASCVSLVTDLWSREGWWCYGHNFHLMHVTNGIKGYDYLSDRTWGYPLCTRPEQDTTFTRLKRLCTIDMNPSCIHHTHVHGLPLCHFQKYSGVR